MIADLLSAVRMRLRCCERFSYGVLSVWNVKKLKLALFEFFLDKISVTLKSGLYTFILYPLFFFQSAYSNKKLSNWSTATQIFLTKDLHALILSSMFLFSFPLLPIFLDFCVVSDFELMVCFEDVNGWGMMEEGSLVGDASFWMRKDTSILWRKRQVRTK